MSQHDYVVDNASGATVRGDLNSALQALASLNSGATAPSTTYGGMLWYDTTNEILKVRDSGDSDWIEAIDLANYPSPILEDAPDDTEASGIIAKMTYGGTVTAGEVLYMDSSGKLQPADASVSTTMPAFALALEAGAADDVKKVLLRGFYRNDTLFNWSTLGGRLYVSETAGDMTQTSPTTISQVVGYATHADRVWFDPQPIDAGGGEILGDGTAGRVLRQMLVYVSDGTAANSIKVETVGVWNGDTIAAEDNLTKGGSTTSFSLSSDGSILTIKNSAITGNGVANLVGVVFYNASGTNVISRGFYSSGLAYVFYVTPTGAVFDLTTLTGASQLQVVSVYLTDA